MYLYAVLYVWIAKNLYANDRSDRNAILRQITGRYFNQSFISVFLSATNPRVANGRGNLLRILSENSTLHVYDSHVKVDFMRNVKPEVMVLFFEGDHDDRKLFSRVREFSDTFSWNSRARVLMIGDGAPSVYMATLWRISRALNAVFWSHDRNEFYAWEPYKKNDCDILKTIHRTSSKSLFKPVNFMNLNGCPLVAAASFIPPFVLRKNNKTRLYDIGVEAEIMTVLADKMNGKLSYIEIPQSELPWVLNTKNGSSVGAMGVLERQEADIAFAGISLIQERFRLAEPLFPYTQDEIRWIGPTPVKGNPVKGLFTVFSVPIWVMAYSLLLFIAILMYYQEGRISFTKCIMDAFLASMNLPTNARNARFLVLLLYVGAMHVVTAYEAVLLFSLVSEVSDKPIETVEEAIEADYFINMPASLQIFVKASYHKIWHRIARPGRFNYSIDLLRHVSAMVANKSTIALYPKTSAIFGINHMYPHGGYSQVVRLLREVIAKTNIAFYTPRGHPLQPVLNRRLLEILAGGFVEMWFNRYLKHEWSEAKDFKMEETRRPLNTSNLRSILVIYVWLSCVSVIVFIAEVLYNRSRKFLLFKCGNRRHFR